MDDETKKHIDDLQRHLIFHQSELIRITARQFATELVLVGYLGEVSNATRDQIMLEIEKEARQLHDKVLLQFENLNPALAAHLDNRDASELPSMDGDTPSSS